MTTTKWYLVVQGYDASEPDPILARHNGLVRLELEGVADLQAARAFARTLWKDLAAKPVIAPDGTVYPHTPRLVQSYELGWRVGENPDDRFTVAEELRSVLQNKEGVEKIFGPFIVAVNRLVPFHDLFHGRRLEFVPFDIQKDSEQEVVLLVKGGRTLSEYGALNWLKELELEPVDLRTLHGFVEQYHNEVTNRPVVGPMDGSVAVYHMEDSFLRSNGGSYSQSCYFLARPIG